MLNMFHNKSKDVKQEEEEENKEWQINTKKVIKYSSWIVNAPKTLCELSIPDSILFCQLYRYGSSRIKRIIE